MGFWNSQNQAYAFNYLRSAGLSNFGAAALVSRWANVESVAAGPQAVNPSSGAFGIAQWLGARKARIYPNTNFDAQLAFVVSELNGSEARAGSVLRSAANPTQGATGASMYERAEGYNAQTGTDNFTSRTALGIASVLALANGTPAPSGNAIAGNIESSGQASAPLILLALAGLGLYLLLK